MRNFFGNRWGKIGLILFVCFALHGFVVSSSYAETCCLCSNGVFVAMGASACSQVCSGPGYTGTSYQLHAGMACNDECSDDSGYCFRENQYLCDVTTNKQDLCIADEDSNTRKCGVFAYGAWVLPETGWIPCPAGTGCFYRNYFDSWDNINRRTTNDLDDKCTSEPYGG